jgi:hypothetical protein
VVAIVISQAKTFCIQQFVMADNLSLTAEQTEKILQFQVMQMKTRRTLSLL